MKVFLLVIINLSLLYSSIANAAGDFTKIHEGVDVLEHIRPPISPSGKVIFATSSSIYSGSGSLERTEEIDLLTIGHRFGRASARNEELQYIQVGNNEELVYLAFKGGTDCSEFVGIYRWFSSTTTTLIEGCRSRSGSGSDSPHFSLSMSGNGTVAAPSKFGLVLWGPSTGPLTGGAERYSSVGNIAINDNALLVFQNEIHPERRITFFPDPNDRTNFVVIASFDIANNPHLAINNRGTIIFSINDSFTASSRGVTNRYPPGIYLSSPTSIDGERRLRSISDNSGDFCHFGAVAINDLDHYVYSAQLNSSTLSSCSNRSGMDGIFNGGNPLTDIIVARGDANLEEHQFFDSLTLGYLNNNDQLSFISTYSEPLVSATYVWRADLSGRYAEFSLAVWARGILNSALNFISNIFQNVWSYILDIFQ